MSVKYYPLKVIKKTFETKNACSFDLSPREEHKQIFTFQPAQFLTFRFLIDKKEYVRSYSIASSPFLDEPLRVTVGRVEGGAVSHYMLSQIKEGDIIDSQEPLGEFFRRPSTLKPQSYVLFGAGIGITPLFSILKTVLNTGLAKKLCLVFSIRDEDNFIYQKELRRWEAEYKEKFSLKLIVSGQEGRLNPQKLSDILSSFNLPETVFYLCGPKSYMKMVSDSLISSGAKETQIRTEDFKVTLVRGPKPDEHSVFFTAPAFSEEGEPETLKAQLNGEAVEIPLNREKSLLEQLLDQGYSPPFSCTSGSCMTCMAKLKEGKIFQLEEGILDEDNINNLEILTCQSYPLSRLVSVDYDEA